MDEAMSFKLDPLSCHELILKQVCIMHMHNEINKWFVYDVLFVCDYILFKSHSSLLKKHHYLPNPVGYFSFQKSCQIKADKSRQSRKKQVKF